MKCPLQGIVLKNCFITTANSIMRLELLPDMKIPVPIAMKSPETKEDMEETYFFIGSKQLKGLDKEGLCTVTNETSKAVLYADSYFNWKNSKLRAMLPFSYTDALMIREKSFISKHKHTGNIKILLWDIEVCSDGSGVFPKASKNPIAMIGYKVIEYNPETTEYTDITGIEILDNFEIEKQGLEDRQIILDFEQVFELHNPDVISGYNSWKFDIPYLLERMQICGIKVHKMAGITQKNLEEKDSRGDAITSLVRNSCSIEPDSHYRTSFGRRLHYDIFSVDVLRDGNLIGLKDRRMKTIAQFLYPEDSNIIILEEGIENIYGMMKSESEKDRLREYLRSDIIQTERICKFYFGMNVLQAEQLEVPLSVVIDRRNGTIPTYYILRELFKNNIIPLRSNSDVFAKLISRKSKQFKEKALFQGAYVDIYRNGKIPVPIYKVDFISLYPNIVRTFNLSYETIKDVKFELIETDPVDDSLETYSYERKGTDLTLSFNDTVLRCRITMTIDFSVRGIIPQIMDRILTDRKNTKLKMKDVGEKKGKNSIEYKVLDSKQLFLKIIANSAYGVLSQSSGIGYLPIGMAITGMGRWMTKNICLYLNREQETDIKRNIFEF